MKDKKKVVIFIQNTSKHHKNQIKHQITQKNWNQLNLKNQNQPWFAITTIKLLSSNKIL
jgi:hypothetical protein